MPSPFPGFLNRLPGIALIFAFWIVAVISISQNPWFVFTEHAFSHLGNPDATAPYLYNYGLIICGAITVLYSVVITRESKNKFETAGGAFALVAGIFLAFIGVFHSGIPEHGFVTSFFFFMIDVAMVAWGAGLLLRGWKRYGLAVLAIGIIGPVIAYAIDWPSAAITEAYAIILINAWLVLMQIVHVER
jgi:hypothetical membrane protein